MKNIDKRIVVIYIFCIGVILLGITYALTSSNIAMNVTTASIGIDTTSYGSTSFDSTNLKLYPILDSKVDDLLTGGSTDVTNNVILINFNVKGASTNPTNTSIIYDIALNNLNINSALLSKYLKWKLIKNGSVLTEGDFSGEIISIENNRMVLTDIQQDLPSYSSTADAYKFVLWLSDACQEEDITKCIDAENQDDLLGKNISGIVEVEIYTGNKKMNR